MTHPRIHTLFAGSYSLSFLLAFATGNFAEAIPCLIGALAHTYAVATHGRRAHSRYYRKTENRKARAA